MVRGASPAIGGPLGEHAGRHRWWTPVRVVLLLTAVAFALGMVKQVPCWNTSWNDGSVRYAQMCYSDLPYLYTGRGLVEGTWPYTDDPQVRERYPDEMEYPPGISYWAWGAARVTHLVTGSPDLSERFRQPVSALGSTPAVQREVLAFVAVNAVGMALLTLLAAWLLVGVNPRRPWDAAPFALLPALALSGLVNWDLLAVVLVAAALWAWARGRPLLTGVLVGVGAATKLYPLFLLGGVLVIAVRRRAWRGLAVTSAGAAGAWLLVNAPAYLTGPEAWRRFWTFNSERGPDLGSWWLILQQGTGEAVSPGTVNLWSWVFFVAWCAGVAALGLLAPRTPRLAQLGFLVVAGFLLVNKVYSPQYVLWLLPLAVLARPRWRDLLVWQAGETFYFAAVWWYLGGYLEPADGGPAGAYWLAIILRLATQLYLVAVVARDVLRPWHDPVPPDRWPAASGPTTAAASADDDAVERGRGEPDPDVDLVTDRRDPGAVG